MEGVFSARERELYEEPEVRPIRRKSKLSERLATRVFASVLSLFPGFMATTNAQEPEKPTASRVQYPKITFEELKANGAFNDVYTFEDASYRVNVRGKEYTVYPCLNNTVQVYSGDNVLQQGELKRGWIAVDDDGYVATAPRTAEEAAYCAYMGMIARNGFVDDVIKIMNGYGVVLRESKRAYDFLWVTNLAESLLVSLGINVTKSVESRGRSS